MTVSKMTLLGASLRRMRNRRNLSIGALAERSGIEKSVISRLENGVQRTAHDENLRALATAFEIPFEVLRELGQRPAAALPEALLNATASSASTAGQPSKKALDLARQMLPALKDAIEKEQDWMVQREMLSMFGEIAQLLAPHVADQQKRQQVTEAGHLLYQVGMSE